MIPHVLLGFDRRTEFLEERHPIPDAVLPQIIALAGTPASDPEAIGEYLLSDDAARAAGAILGVTLDLDRCTYDLSPSTG